MTGKCFVDSNVWIYLGVSFWDSLVIAAALEAGCDTFASEDMQDGMKFGNVIVRNIFT